MIVEAADSDDVDLCEGLQEVIRFGSFLSHGIVSRSRESSRLNV